MSGRGRNLLGRGSLGVWLRRGRISLLLRPLPFRSCRGSRHRERDLVFDESFGEEAGENGAVHLNHVGEVEIQDVPDRFLMVG